MIYTVGLRRRFGLGWKKYKVVGHSWREGRLILEFQDGQQIHIPGVKVRAFKVYPDLKAAITIARQVEEAQKLADRQREAEIRQAEFEQWQEQQQQQALWRQQSLPDGQLTQTQLAVAEQPQGQRSLLEQAQESAHARVRGILQGGG